jgi:phosphoribosylaminoimidazole carboxylase PurE protein
MKREPFEEQVRRNRGAAVILAGSDSDLPHVETIAEALREYAIPCAVRICSAHKEPGRLMALIGEYNRMEGALAFIAVAGGTDALSGTLSFHALHPVVSCPPDAPNESCLRNPPGSSNAYVALPRNAARFVAQLFAHLNPHARGQLEREQGQKVEQLARKDREVRGTFEGA